jgi:hypothetical protein
LISKKFEMSSKVLFGTGSGLSKNAGSGSVLNQSGSTTLNQTKSKSFFDSNFLPFSRKYSGTIKIAERGLGG